MRVRGKLFKLVPLVAVLGLTLAASSAVLGGSDENAIVFGGSDDPAALDGALVSDGESLRVIDQMFEGLVGLAPGSTRITPALATRWRATNGGRTWNFDLRQGVRFHDDTPFNAQAVCFNFNRWYNFRGSFQSPDATYYWQTVFGGFRRPEKGSPKGSLFRSCQALGQNRVRIKLVRPSGSFLGALSLTAFSIASPTALRQYQADVGRVDADGVFRPTGTYATEHPTGTGPYRFVSWNRGNRLELARNDTYWGRKARLERLIFRPIDNNAARLQALQTGEVQGYDLVAPEDIRTINNNRTLKTLDRPAFNVAYVGINQAMAPMNNPLVRQAVAYGLNREQVVRNFYGGRAEVAHAFMPPSVVGYARNVKRYSYNPDRARQLLRQAGLTLPVRIEFWYPSNVSRPYMPDPRRNFEAFAASLERAGFEVVPKTAQWSPEYLSAVDTGKAGHLRLLGWTGDYGDPDNFIGTFFQAPQAAWGFRNPALHNLLDRAETEANQARRTALYQQANRLIAQFLPGVPYAHSRPALGFQRRVLGYVPSPVSLESFAAVRYGGR